MPYITREDGEHFVIPSYRDVLTAKNNNTLKKEILLLSQNYGEFITLQRKSAAQFEVAFSPDTGYLLGESIWHQFKRPLDMVYCEIIPNTTEAILVIVKTGSVYLDGSFPLESIPEELIIFLTQQNNFEIYLYGDVPISQTPEPGKFTFEPSSVKSFTILDKPVFQTLPLLKMYQLQRVDVILKAQGIGVFPVRKIIIGLAAIGLLWILYAYFTSEKPVEVPVVSGEANPYQGFYTALTSPAPDQTIQSVLQNLQLFFVIPGWQAHSAVYQNGTLTVNVTSNGGRVENLNLWAKANGTKVDLRPDGFYLIRTIPLSNRSVPTKIYSLKEVISKFIDGLNSVYPGNNITVADINLKNVYLDMTFSIKLNNVSPTMLALIGDQFKDLPFVLQGMTLTIDNGNISGTINMEALGSQL